MPIKMKDIDELKAKAIAKLKAFKAKGMDDQSAQDLVKDYLTDNEFVNEEGHCLKLSLETIADDDTADDAPAMDGKAMTAAVAAGVKEGLKGLNLETKGKPVSGTADVEVKEDYERLWDHKKSGKRFSDWEFDNVGEFALAVFKNDNPDVSSRVLDPRLAMVKKAKMAILNGQFKAKSFSGNTKATPTTYASELVGADGGFAVPPEYREEIWIAVQERESILSTTDLTPTNSNVVNLVADENTPWDTTSGIIVNTRAQGTTMTQTKPVLQNRQIQLNEVYALVPATDELLADAPRLNNYLTVKAPQKIGFKVDELIFRGRGNGEPLGFFNSPSLITVTSASSANTFTVLDLSNMYSRLLVNSMNENIGDWYMTRRAMAYSLNLTLGSTTGFPIAMQDQSLARKIIPTVIGLPMRSSQHASAWSSAGDVILADMKGYASFVKTDGIDFQTSIHLFFDSGATAFRWRFRIGGEPYLKQPVTPFQDTANTMGHFIALGGRA